MKMTMTEFASLLASDAPAPGGGSVAAFNLVLGAALLEMVASLTIGRKKYAEVQEDIAELKRKAGELRQQATDLVQKDTMAYNAVRAAYALPRESAEDKTKRREAILAATRVAIQVPLETAKLAISILELVPEAFEKGNTNAASDALVAAYECNAGCLSAFANIYINLDSLDDEAEVMAYRTETDKLRRTLDSLMQRAALLGKAYIG